MGSSPISRRRVLKAAGSIVALPWLEAMTPRRAVGQKPGPGHPLRVGFFYVPNGMHMPNWTPERSEGDWELPPTLEALAPHRDRINVLSGLTLNGARALGDGPGDHARAVAAFLTGAHPKKTDGTGIRNGQSIDQLLAERLGGQTRLASLEVGVEPSAAAGQCDSGYSCVYTSNMSWRTDTSPVPKEINPRALFDRLFGKEFDPQARQLAARRRRLRRSVLDVVTGDAKQLSGLLGTADRRRLDEFLHAVRDIERRIESSDALDTTEPELPDYARPAGVPAHYDEHVKLLMDVMALAWQTDATRILTFMYANAGSNRSYRNLDIRTGHHDLSHHGGDDEKQEQIARINRFHVELFAHFIDRLATAPEGEGSVLDHSIIVYGSGISDGNAHNHDDLPVLTVGGGNGRIVTGQHLRFKDETPLTNLYLTLAGEMGVDVDEFGDSTGRLPKLVTR